MGLGKRFDLTRRIHAELRAEVLNVFDNLNFYATTGTGTIESSYLGGVEPGSMPLPLLTAARPTLARKNLPSFRMLPFLKVATPTSVRPLGIAWTIFSGVRIR